MAVHAEWVRGVVPGHYAHLARMFLWMGLNHWSRQFEYPWALANGQFGPRQWVLDAGGGNECCLLQYALADLGCSVVNVDVDPAQLRPNGGMVLNLPGDMRTLPFHTDSFHRVVCVSVLEHVDDPLKALFELWRVLIPGGRLVMTMDVVDKPHLSGVPDLRHTLTDEAAARLVLPLGLELPPVPPDAATHKLEGSDSTIRVLCLYADKVPPA